MFDEAMKMGTKRPHFYNAKRMLSKYIYDYVRPDLFMADMRAHDLVDDPTEDYGEDVYNLCRNGATWLAGKLRGIVGEQDIRVIDGRFNGRPHTWIQYGGLYLDLTLAQFKELGEFPQFAVTRVEKAQGWPYYQADITYTVQEWAQVALQYG